MTYLNEIVFKVTCGQESSGTAFLISKSLVLTAFHVIKEHKDNEIVISNGRNEVSKAKLSELINDNYEYYKKTDIALLELSTVIPYENRIDFVDYINIPKGTKWCSRGFPGTKNLDADNILENDGAFVTQQLKELRNHRVDIELQHNKKLVKYSGYSGGPLIIDNSIAGILLSELFENGVSKELNAQSIKHFSDLLSSHGISIQNSLSPIIRMDRFQLNEYSQDVLSKIPSMIGGKLSIERKKLKDSILKQQEENHLMLLIGESGSGKSVLAKSLSKDHYKGNVLWLDHYIFESSDLHTVNTKLNISDFNSALVSELTDENYLVVFDGLERICSDSSFALVAQLLSIISSSNSGPKILLTCQQTHWQRVQTNLYKHFHKIIDIKTLTVGNFEQDELQKIIKEFPQFSKLFATSKLATMLQRPKIIDFFTRNPELPNISEWSSEADLIEWYWKMEISQKNNGAMRESFILNLTCKLGDSGRSSIRTSALSPSELTIMEDLEKDGICTRHKNQIKFSHDLLLDWFKQRVILDYLDEEPEYCFSKIDSPSWYRAITLFGLHLLEHGNSVISWDELFKKAEVNTETSFTCDLLLDSIIYSQQPGKYIKSIWPVLVNNKAKYLKALINRFLFIATIPDPFILRLAKKEGIGLVEASTINRKLLFPLWPSILEIINSNKNELLEIIPVELGEICKTWLHRSPQNADYRKQIASIALEMGWRALQHKQHYRSGNSYNNEKIEFFYEVAFSAINEELSELIKLIFCASGLSKPTEELPLKIAVLKSSFEPVATLDELEPTYSFFNEKIVLPPIEDGPQWPVQNDFQHFFLKEHNSQAFMLARPKVASKLLLALCIRESGETYGGYNYGFDKYYDLASNPRFFPPAFNKGTFLQLLRISPDDGLMVILRLTEVATDKWLEDIKISKNKSSDFDNENDVISLSFEVEGKVKNWIGDGRWMYACRDTTSPPDILVCALMALEKWLSDKIDKKKDITKDILFLLDKSNSMAIIGVLLQLAKKSPILFRNVLFDLICVPEFFYYDIKHVINGEGHQLMGFQFHHTEEEIKQAREWNLREYRKKYLEDIFIDELINDEAFQERVKVKAIPAFKRWKDENNEINSIYSYVIKLIHSFNIDNWRYYKDEEGLPKVELIIPDKIIDKENIEKNYNELTLEMINITWKCREIIDGNKPPNEEGMINALEKYSFMELEDAGVAENLSLAHTQCALASVVVKNKNELPELWKQYEQWCLDTLLGTVSNPPTEIYNIPDSVYSSGWDRFCADTIPLLWSESPENKNIRAAVANLCIGLHLETVERLFNSSAIYRVELNGGFYQLLHLATIWSSYSHRISISSKKHRGTEKLRTDELHEEFDSYYKEFINSTLPSKVPSLHSIESTFSNPLHCYEEYGKREARPRSINLNLKFLKRAYAWLPELTNISNLNEKTFVFEFWRQCVEIIKWQLFDDKEQYDSLDGMPYEFDKWLFARLSKVIISCDTSVDAKKLWLPILKLGPVAHYWIKDFTYEWFSLLGEDSLDKVKFINYWKEMLDFCLTDSSWCKNKNHYTDCWSSLLGLESIIINHIWSQNNSVALNGMEKYYEDYALNCSSSNQLNEIVRFLKTRSSEGFRLMGLTWVDAALNKSAFYFNDKRDEENIALLVKTVLETSGNLNQLSEQYKSPLLRILRILAERKNSLAMAIYESDLI